MPGKGKKGKKDGNVVEQLTQFYHESDRFLRKCEKPSKKGKRELTTRVHEDPSGLCDWVPGHGIHRLLRQTHFHSYQQHHLGH